MVVAIIQARMGSTRLPGKVLKKINNIPLLVHQVKRVSKAKLIDKIIVATSALGQDDDIIAVCEENNIEYFRGSELDCLDRYYRCAKNYGANVIVRLTADCPLSDPQIIDDTVQLFINANVDYAANTIPPETSKYPDGSDVEVFGFKALERAFYEAKSPYDREHVTFFFWKYDNGFKRTQLDYKTNLSQYRVTVDYPEDLEVVEFVMQELKKRNSFGHLDEIIEIIDSNPDIKRRNSKYCFGIGWLK